MNQRKSITRREIELAILRIQKKRPRRLSIEACRLSITSVASEAGITPAAIHNCYPDIAEKIRMLVGRSSREQRDRKGEELQRITALNRQQTKELNELRQQVSKLASINASLTLEVSIQRARLLELDVVAAHDNVMPLHAAAHQG